MSTPRPAEALCEHGLPMSFACYLCGRAATPQPPDTSARQEVIDCAIALAANLNSGTVAALVLAVLRLQQERGAASAAGGAG